MKVIAPLYYRDFRCIASACRHSCCVGWEIDIDEKTLRKYENMRSPLGERIRASIDYADTPHVRLAEDGRCPHLLPSELCSIICECGDEGLCQICRDHPRYRNLYESVTEIGLGLSCEAAAALMLSAERALGFLVSEDEDMTSSELYTEYPTELFSEEDRAIAEEKKRLLSIASDSGKSIEERLKSLLPILPSVDEIKALYLSAEPLDESWRDKISSLSAEDFSRDLDKNSVFAERMLIAFIFRHISSESFYEPRTAAAFAALSVRLILALSRSPEDLPDTLRAYSAEVEYSVENTERILDFIEERI